MARIALLGMAMVMAASGVAHASGRHEKWNAVRSLAAGVPVEVELKQGRPEECTMVTADDVTLTCERERDPNVNWSPGDGARVIFPRDAVRAVWVWEPVRERHIGLWIAGGLGFALGARICAVGGPGLIVTCGALGALVAMSVVVSSNVAGPVRYPGVWFPAPPPPRYPVQQPEWHRKLRYRAPVPVQPNGAATP
jgi:hypothetical protein